MRVNIKDCNDVINYTVAMFSGSTPCSDILVFFGDDSTKFRKYVCIHSFRDGKC